LIANWSKAPTSARIRTLYDFAQRRQLGPRSDNLHNFRRNTA
jgi:hypothetical protein